jgi:sugar phosphate isomerase/epimerase
VTLNRREFLSAIPAAGAVLASSSFIRWSGPIGVQLYTVRNLLEKDFRGTLRRVAEIGFREVEFAGYFGHDPKEIRAELGRNGLTAPSAHVPIPVLGKAWDKTIDDALTVGHQYLITSWIDEKDRTLKGYHSFAALFNKAGEACRKRGIQFGFHNHDFVFFQVDRQLPYDLLLRETDPSLVTMEMDVYWVRKGGKDPLDYLHRYPGRFSMLHLKDIDSAGRMADVGKGVLPWREILRAGEIGGMKHVFVEHDEPVDPFASIRDSYRYLRALNT